MKARTSPNKLDKVFSFAPSENSRRCAVACLTNRSSRVVYQTQSCRTVVGMMVV